MGDHQRVKRKQEVVYRDLAAGESAVLLHVSSGNYHGLTGTGSLIWGLIDGERTRDDIVNELRRRFPDAPDDLAADVDRFLDDLRRRDLIDA
jgi:hypothetical protein